MTKLLYVEDNDDNVYMLKMRLELLGDFEVLTAENGERGYETAVAERPDIILMDLEMPIVDGWEATRRLKNNPATRDIPVIAFSAHALAGERDKALAAGCDEFDTKPVEFDRLVATVQRLLTNRRDVGNLKRTTALTFAPAGRSTRQVTATTVESPRSASFLARRACKQLPGEGKTPRGQCQHLV